MSYFNPAQLSTWSEAHDLVTELTDFEKNFGLIGNGIPPIDETAPQKSGVYVLDWLPGPAAFPIPHGTNEAGEPTFWLHLRFNNGREGVNVGLVLDRLRRYPFSHGYVLRALAQEVNTAF